MNPSIPCTGSPDISALSYSVLFDISGAVPNIVLTNLSALINPTKLIWWYVITTPSGTPIHSGSLISPDVPYGSTWNNLSIPANSWPLPFGSAPCGQVEFSNNAPYIVTLYVKDSAGNTFSLQINTTITRPNGNTVNSCGNFGVANVSIEVNCNTKVIFCNDSTNFTYQSQLIPIASNNIWTLVYPPDLNGNQPTNGTADNTPYVNFPINYSGSNYVVYLQDYASYDMGNGATVKVQYKAINPQSGMPGLPFAVLCNIDFCQLQCQIQTAYEVAKKKCGNVEDPGLNSKLTRANMLMNMATWGVMQPTCGIDVPALIKEIQRLLDLDPNCNCGCGDTGINFSYPTGVIPSPNNGCCPTIVPVNQFGTGAPPPPCPNSYFPVIVYAPNGITPIGYATDMETLLSIINSNPAWQVIGEAFNAGNCQVGFYLNAGQTAVTVIVNTNTTGSGTIIVNLSNHVGGGTPPGCPNSFYPATVYDPTNTIIIGTANNATQLLNIINANAAWNAYGIATAVVNCQVVFYPNTGVTIIPVVGITSNGGGSGSSGDPILVPIYIHTTSTPPTGCPGAATYFPCSVYDPTDTTIIGTATTITQLLTILNSNAAWVAYGTFSIGGNCTVNVTPVTGVSTIPPVHVASTACIGGTSTSSVNILDFSTGLALSGTLIFPSDFYVNWGGSPPTSTILLGSIASETALIAALNAAPGKPSTITFSAGTSSLDLNITVTNTGCSTTPTPTIYGTNRLGSEQVVYGANHSNLQSPPGTIGAIDVAYLPTLDFIGRVAGINIKEIQWHLQYTAATNTIYATETNTGTVYVINVTNPIAPTLSATISLPALHSNNFQGLPIINGRNSWYNLYMPTDYIGANPANLFVSESNSGSLWGINTATNVVSFGFSDARLLGKCPRVLINNILYFTQDGYMETAGGLSSGVSEGVCVTFNALDTTSTGISEITIIQNDTEYVYSAAYDGSQYIYFVGALGTIVVYSTVLNAVVNTYTHFLATTYTAYQNTRYGNNVLYVSGWGQGTLMVAISGGVPGTITVFESITLPGGSTPNTMHWNFIPVPSTGVGLLTMDMEGTDTAAGYGIFDLSGNYLGQITNTHTDIYNAIVGLVAASTSGSTLLPMFS